MGFSRSKTVKIWLKFANFDVFFLLLPPVTRYSWQCCARRIKQRLYVSEYTARSCIEMVPYTVAQSLKLAGTI